MTAGRKGFVRGWLAAWYPEGVTRSIGAPLWRQVARAGVCMARKLGY